MKTTEAERLRRAEPGTLLSHYQRAAPSSLSRRFHQFGRRASAPQIFARRPEARPTPTRPEGPPDPFDKLRHQFQSGARPTRNYQDAHGLAGQQEAAAGLRWLVGPACRSLHIIVERADNRTADSHGRRWAKLVSYLKVGAATTADVWRSP